MKLFSWYLKTNLLWRILAGLVLGAPAGVLFGPKIAWVGPFGDIFVRLLKMIVMPVVLFTLVVGAASIHPAQLGRVGAKALMIYMLTTGLAVALGLAAGNLFRPGQGMVFTSLEGTAGTEAIAPPSLVETVLNNVSHEPLRSHQLRQHTAHHLLRPIVRHRPGLFAPER